MSINLDEDIHSINELRGAPEKLLDNAGETRRPLVNTIEGRSVFDA